MRRLGGLLLLLAAGCASRGPSVVLVTIDGVRWQEIFRGAEDRLMTAKGGGVADVVALSGEFGRDTAEERRRALAPFLWDVVAREGRLMGDVDRGGEVRVDNPHRISCPGYHEILSGFSSETIDSNLKIPNPDVTVLEWLSGRPGFEGSVAAFCSWDVFPSILNRDRARGVKLNAGEAEPGQDLINRLKAEAPAPWAGSVLDAFVFHAAIEYVRREKPRVLYLAFGDTDEWAHAGRYDHYLRSIRRSDAWLRELWDALQALPEYRGTTSMIVTCYHGRGSGPSDWRHHHSKVEGADFVWVAAIGPQVVPGDRSDGETPVLGQVASTAAALVREDFASTDPRVEPPLRLGD